MSEKLYHPSNEISQQSWIQSMDQYQEMYYRSVNDSDAFWNDQAKEFTWFKKWEQVRRCNYDIRKGKISIEWFIGGKTNITVNCIAPGYISTDMTENLSEDLKNQMKKTIPMGRFGTPKDVANLALFLASDESDYITGQTITVDGGMVMN